MSEASELTDNKNKSEEISLKFKLHSINLKTRVRYLDYISVIKIISAYAVIILHTNPFWGDNFKNFNKWIFANFIEQIFFFGVPFFVICIGATLLDFNEKYGLLVFYKRRFSKVVLPLIGWNIISYYYRIYFVKNLKKIKFDIVDILNIFFTNKLYGLFYSFHIFMITYMIIPLLAYVEKSLKIKIYLYCFFTLLITQSLIPYIIEVFHINVAWPYKISVGYIIYIFSGYILENHKFSKKLKIFIYIIGFFSFLTQLIGTHVITYRYKRVILIHTGYLKFPTILYCNSLFLFIKEYCYLLFKIVNRDIIKNIGSLTIGPFFLHWPVIDFFHKYPKLIFHMNLFTFYGGSLLCIICFILTFLLKKIPLIKYILP